MSPRIRTLITGIILVCAIGLIAALVMFNGGAPTWGGLPTVTPPGPGEPTLPPEALSMRAAPSATPSPIPPIPSLTPTPTATPTPVSATGSDDVPMVEVQAGEFIMGSTRQQVNEYVKNNESEFSIGSEFVYRQTPQLTVYLDTFSIDQLEVTVARYHRCVEAGICHPAAAQVALPDDYPVIGVTWDDATAYCHWMGKRLPSEAEWEKAARGTDGRWYPWGNDWGDDRANLSLWDIKALKPVGSYPAGASPYGVLDMGGNALEWTSDTYGPYPGQPDSTSLFPPFVLQHRAVRGRQVGWNRTHPGPPMSTTMRASYNAQHTDDIIGFRCIEGPEQDWRNQVIRTSIPSTQAPLTPDLSQMAYIPAGEFLMGIDGEQDDSWVVSPAHIVYLDSFYIDRYETTVADFAGFLNALGENDCGAASCLYGSKWIEMVNGRYQAQSGFGDRAVCNVSWWGAHAYCHWRGKRLPTDAEWEKAARGTDGRLYPWGNDWEPERAALYDIMLLPGTYPVPVGSHPGDVSPYGVYDMLGNVAEWVSDWYSSTDPPTYYAESPYANPQGPDRGWNNWRMSRGPAAGISKEGLILRVPGGWGETGIRCVYTP